MQAYVAQSWQLRSFYAWKTYFLETREARCTERIRVEIERRRVEEDRRLREREIEEQKKDRSSLRGKARRLGQWALRKKSGAGKVMAGGAAEVRWGEGEEGGDTSGSDDSLDDRDSSDDDSDDGSESGGEGEGEGG